MGSLLGGRQEQLRLDARNAIQLRRIADVSRDATRRQFRWRIVVGSSADASYDATGHARAEALSEQQPAIPISEVGARACRRLNGRVVVKVRVRLGTRG